VATALLSGAACASAPSTVSPPRRWDLTSPESAVRSYLAWVTYSYRMVDSGLSTPTMEPTETVRVDSYIQLNRERGRGIDQRLVTLRVTRLERTAPDLATIVTYEEWEYRYFDIADPARSLSSLDHATYAVAYSVVRGQDGLWRVARVDASPRGEVR
jgi:hypothetical protein